MKLNLNNFLSPAVALIKVCAIIFIIDLSLQSTYTQYVASKTPVFLFF